MTWPPPQPPRRALVIKLGHIGDVLVTTPVMAALKQAWPGLRLTAVVREGTEAMLEHSPLVDRLLVVRRHAGQGEGLAGGLRLVRELRRESFDLALELSGGDRGAFLAWASGARHRLGFAPKEPHFRARAFHQLVDGRGTANHVVETFLRQPRALGLEPGQPPLVLEPGQAARQRAGRVMAEHGLRTGEYVVVHPTSRWMFKTWTPAGNARVMEHLARRGFKIVLSAAPAEAEVRFVEELRRQLPPGVVTADLAGKLDLHLLGALLAEARLFFGVDSAPMHMAAAVGTPTVALFGPSGEAMWGPWRVEHEVVTKPGCDCRPCGRDGCDGSKVSRCLTELDAGQVCKAVDRLLERTQACASA